MNTKEVLRVVRDAVSSHTGCEKELYEGLNPFLIRAEFLHHGLLKAVPWIDGLCNRRKRWNWKL